MRKKKWLFMILLFIGGCVAAKTDFQTKMGIVNDKLDHLLDQSSSLQTTAESIENLSNTVKQQLVDKVELLGKHIQAGTINNNGAGWVVALAGVMALIFVGAIILSGYLLIRGNKLKMLLGLVTKAVQDAPPEAQDAVKQGIAYNSSNGGPWKGKHKRALAEFARKAGTFAVQKAKERLTK